MSEKRVKAGIALTPKHLKLCDENLTRAGVRSRNSFVERAVLCELSAHPGAAPAPQGRL